MEDQNENQLQKVQPTAIQAIDPNSPASLMERLMSKEGAFDVEGFGKMLEYQAKHEDRQAKKAYHVAMAEFKADPPKIIKDLQNKQYDSKYASLGNVTDAIGTELSKFGLSAKWLTSQKESGWPEVACVITHIQGHSESTNLSAPPDDSGSKNPIQRIISTVTYLERATLLALTGLATYDQDDDGNGAGEKKKPKILDPNEQEQKFIDAVCAKLPPETGKIVNRRKVGLVLYRKRCKYPSDMDYVDQGAEYVMEKSGAEGFYMDDSGDDLGDIGNG